MTSGAMVTADNLRDVGIAADMAANPNMLPSPSIYFQDFNFGATMFDAAYGNVEGGSISGVGAGVSDIAIDERIAVETKRRKEDDPAADASMITELAEQQREAMHKVTYSNGQLHMFGMDINEGDMDVVVDETLGNIDEIAARHGLDAQQKVELATLLLAYKNADTPEEKAEILSDIAETQPEIAREMGQDALDKQEARNQNNLTNDELENADTAQVEDENDFVEARVQSLDRVAAVGENIAVRNNQSIGESPFPDTRSASADFAPAVQGQNANTELAQNAVKPDAPSQAINATLG